MNPTKRIFRFILGFVTSSAYLFISRGVVVLVLIVGFYFTQELLSDPTANTVHVTNIAFGVVATLAALSFSCSRGVQETAEDKDKFQFAGERLLHAATLLMSGSLIKYALLEIGNRYDAAEPSWLPWVSGIPGLLFLWALLTAHGGFLIVNKLLWKRHNRHPDWDNFF